MPKDTQTGTRIQIGEQLNDEGSPVGSFLSIAPGNADVQLWEDDRASATLALAAFLHVFRRYARPLDDQFVPTGPTIVLSNTMQLLQWGFRSKVDLENKNYLVLLEKDKEAISVLSQQVCNAVVFLTKKP